MSRVCKTVVGILNEGSGVLDSMLSDESYFHVWVYEQPVHLSKVAVKCTVGKFRVLILFCFGSSKCETVRVTVQRYIMILQNCYSYCSALHNDSAELLQLLFSVT